MLLIREDGSLNPQSAGFTNIEAANRWLRKGAHFYRPQQAADTTSLDPALLHPAIRKWVEKHLGANGVYSHQKLMVEGAIAGQNIISTTPTGSGKSLGFMLPAFHKVLSDPTARVIAFYPLRALGQDQIDKWFAMAQELGLGAEFVQRVDGSVLIGERPEKLRKARIILATPDVIHAWFMGALDTEEVRNFLSGVQLKIIDEVHAYDGIFGTNTMYLLRRMDHIQSMLTKDYDPKIHRQYIGASGTLPDAPKNFKQLTGVEGTHIGVDKNGAPLQRQNVFHATNMHYSLASFMEDAVDVSRQQTVVFVDSRIKAEEYTHQIRDAYVDSPCASRDVEHGSQSRCCGHMSGLLMLQ